MKLELVESKTEDDRKPWETDEVKADVATRGFHNVTLTLNSIKATASILTEIFSYKLIEQDVNRYRYATDAAENASIIDLVELTDEKRGQVANGSIHHVAFRVKNDEILMHFREKIEAFGLSVTPHIDRKYFHSLYFREPGGVLFEFATENPGFMIDENLEELGKNLKLPAQYEANRAGIEAHLVKIN